jgi:hypothetical protein
MHDHDLRSHVCAAACHMGALFALGKSNRQQVGVLIAVMS